MTFALECLASFWLACLLLNLLTRRKPRALTPEQQWIDKFRSDHYKRLDTLTDEAERGKVFRALYEFERGLRRAKGVVQ